MFLVGYWEEKSFGTSLRRLSNNVMGATRPLLTYREIRQPDCVAHGLAAAALGAFHVVRGHRRGSVFSPRFVLAVGIQHVRSRFEMPLIDRRRLAPAVAADSALLTAYFLGRLAGLSWLRRRG